MISLATESTLKAAVLFAEGDPTDNIDKCHQSHLAQQGSLSDKKDSNFHCVTIQSLTTLGGGGTQPKFA